MNPGGFYVVQTCQLYFDTALLQQELFKANFRISSTNHKRILETTESRLESIKQRVQCIYCWNRDTSSKLIFFKIYTYFAKILIILFPVLSYLNSLISCSFIYQFLTFLATESLILKKLNIFYAPVLCLPNYNLC